MSNESLIQQDIDKILIMRQVCAVVDAAKRINDRFLFYDKAANKIDTPMYDLALIESDMDLRIIGTFVHDLRNINDHNTRCQLAKKYPDCTNKNNDTSREISKEETEKRK